MDGSLPGASVCLRGFGGDRLARNLEDLRRLVGIAGFIPGLTMDMGLMSMAGHGSMALLLGLFQVSVLHNIVHLLFGIVGLLAARTATGARLYLLVGSIVYLVLRIYALFTADMAGAATSSRSTVPTTSSAPSSPLR
ncbi:MULTISPECIES: DUF4383 domain-containing protein [unclassified Curtobacterium]|uniref:DUF4383 domain-containing protein n=2 Tax=unclassified Curtobacterium TaxID=257496 RepID=UPI001FB25590|nr:MULTISPECIES: DUF4383 domain-containing protein [unclassified Curtobacterium]